MMGMSACFLRFARPVLEINSCRVLNCTATIIKSSPVTHSFYSPSQPFKTAVSDWRSSIRMFSGTTTVYDVQKTSSNGNLPPMNTQGQGIQQTVTAKKRAQRKRRTPVESEAGGTPSSPQWDVCAYATAEDYDLEKLMEGLQHQGLYHATSMSEDIHDVLHVSARYQVGREPREIYFFREGSVVFWNVAELERQSVLKFLNTYEDGSYDPDIVSEETEMMVYTYTEVLYSTQFMRRRTLSMAFFASNKTRLMNGRILLNAEGSTDLEKYTFSNAMALSVKLGIWEASLDRYVDSIESVTEDLKNKGRIKLSRPEVLKKQGELFTLRHLINLSSDLLDTPDFYWDRENLETMYHKTCNHLNIAKRTKVMNEKLNHCCELVNLLSHKLTDNHHTRLEWMIIALITVEVLFELVHFVNKLNTKMSDPSVSTLCCLRSVQKSWNDQKPVEFSRLWALQESPYHTVCLVAACLGLIGSLYQITVRKLLRSSSGVQLSVAVKRSNEIVTWLAIADGFASLGIILRSTLWLLHEGTVGGQLWCPILSGFIQYFYTAATLWTLCYAIDVHRIILEKSPLPRLYQVVCWGLSGVLCLTGLIILYYPQFDPRINPFTRVLPNFVVTYFPTMVVMVSIPVLYWASSTRAKEILIERMAKYTRAEQQIIRNMNQRFWGIVVVYTVCWAPNIVNAFLLWTQWEYLPQNVLLVNWYCMALLNPLQALLNAFVYRSKFQGDVSYRNIPMPWRRKAPSDGSSDLFHSISEANEDTPLIDRS